MSAGKDLEAEWSDHERGQTAQVQLQTQPCASLETVCCQSPLLQLHLGLAQQQKLALELELKLKLTLTLKLHQSGQLQHIPRAQSSCPGRPGPAAAFEGARWDPPEDPQHPPRGQGEPAAALGGPGGGLQSCILQLLRAGPQASGLAADGTSPDQCRPL